MSMLNITQHYEFSEQWQTTIHIWTHDNWIDILVAYIIHFWFLYMYQHIYANEHNTHDKSAYLYIYGPYIGTVSKWLHSSFSFFSQSHRPIILVAVCNKILLKNSDGITLNKDTK